MYIEIPSVGAYNIKNILFDYNGTIATDGQTLNLKSQLENLSKKYNLFVLTGDTFGDVKDSFQSDHVSLTITKTADDKLAAIQALGPETCIAVGNGSIDYKMLQAAAIGIAVIGDEGCSTKALLHADIIVKDIHHVFSLIDNPTKIIATLKE